MYSRFCNVAFGAGLAAVVLAHSASGQAGGAIPVAQEFERLHFRSIGPATMSGRVADLAVYEANPSVYYVATAHGGVWKTTNAGAHFTPLLQDQGLMSFGAIAMSQRNPDLVWAGGGESNNRQSTSWGDGIYKSTDGGRTFQHMGLRDSKHINRIVIDPNNNDVVFVAATGALYGAGGERGVYKTTDGGRTWRRVLNVDENTGANDLVQSHADPRVMYATTYQRRRSTCCFIGNGPGSGIWKSTDAGETWTRLTGNGIPAGSLGRIAVDVYRGSSNIVYALIEAGGGGRGGRGAAAADESAAAEAAGGGRAGGGGGGGGGRAGGGGAGGGGGGSGIYRSDDGGQTWRFASGTNPRPMYFSQIRVDPSSPDRIYLGGVGMHMSIDGGRTVETDAALVTHDDVHAIWVNPRNADHLIIGNDGGVYETRDMSKSWTFMQNIPVGLFYHVGFDMEYPFTICGGMQDNYNWCGPSASRMGRGIMNYDWFQIQGGDGFVAQPDLRDSRIIYTESQDGNMTRKNKITGESKSIRPTAANVVNAVAGEPGYRFHWDSPMVLSPHDPGILLVAANRVFKSTDRGDSWTAISPDLTKNENRASAVTMGVTGCTGATSCNDGISNWPAIVTLAESPKQPGVIYTGTDDGTVQATRDGGKTWSNITKNLPGLPAGYVYVSEVVPSRFDAATVYVTVENHRENDYEPHIWVSNDFGATFRSLNGNLRGEVVRTLTEDLRNPDVLYIGTETGIFLTLDRGRSWRRLKANFPMVRVDELTIHPRENALLVASHGRALWILDHLEPIQDYTAAQTADAKLFSVPNALQWKTLDNRNEEFWGHHFFTGENPPTDAVIQFHLKRAVTNPLLRITDASGARVRDLPITGNRNAAGIQTVCWDQRVEPIATPADSAPAGGRGGGGGAGGGAGGRGGAAGGAPGGRGGGGGAAVPGVPVPLPPVGYQAANPCGGGGGGGGGGGRGGGGGGGAGPHVAPGTYTVSLVVENRVVDSKPMRIVMDPAVQFTDAARKRYNDILVDLHEMQRRATDVASRVNAIYGDMIDVASKIKDKADVPAGVKSQFESLARDYDAVRVKFGVPLDGGQVTGLASAGLGVTAVMNMTAAQRDSVVQALASGRGGGGGGRGGGGGGGGRGGRGGGGGPDENVLGRAAAIKGAIGGIWETPSDAMVKQYTDVKAALPAAVTQANAMLTRATTVSQALVSHNLLIRVTGR